MKLLVLIFLCPLFFHNLQGQIDTIEASNYIKKVAKTPEDYLIDKFNHYDVVLLGEKHLVKQNLLLIQNIIPKLYKNGIYTIGMEFGAFEHQSKMDSLLVAEEYDAPLAERMMFDYNVTWAYQEYVDVARAAWEFNRLLPKDARPFRILNLSYRYHWENFKGKRNPETMQQVFHMGPADLFRANVIETQVLAKQEKILALVGTPHAYTRYGSPYFLYNADNFCAYDDNWLGNRLYKKYPTRIFSIILHQPFTQKREDDYFLISPLDGFMEELMLQNENRPVGFDLVHTPVGKLPDHSINALCYDNFTLDQFFDGYIFLEPINAHEQCTIISDFVNLQNLERALEQFPDPDWHRNVSTLEEINEFILENSTLQKL